MIQSQYVGPVVVTGATGRVGRPLVELLLAEGCEVRAVTRRPSDAQMPHGLDVTDSVFEALSGAGAVFLNSRALGAQLDAVVSDAVAGGTVRRLVALSAANIADDDSRQPSRFRGDRNREVDQLAMRSGLSAVSLRPAVFASTSADMWANQIRLGDVVRGPYALSAFAPVVDEDIAAVAAAALTTGEADGRSVVLTGPEILSVADQVGILGDVLGRPLRFEEVGPDAVRAAMTANGLAPQFVDAYLALQAAAVSEPVQVSTEICEILGRAPSRFADWVSVHRNVFEQVDR